jgi:hypothetical protein
MYPSAEGLGTASIVKKRLWTSEHLIVVGMQKGLVKKRGTAAATGLLEKVTRGVCPE